MPISRLLRPMSVNCPVRAAITASQAARPLRSGSVEANPGGESETKSELA